MLLLLLAFFIGATAGMLAAYGTVRFVRRQARLCFPDKARAARQAATSRRRRFSGDGRYAWAVGGSR